MRLEPRVVRTTITQPMIGQKDASARAKAVRRSGIDQMLQVACMTQLARTAPERLFECVLAGWKE